MAAMLAESEEALLTERQTLMLEKLGTAVESITWTLGELASLETDANLTEKRRTSEKYFGILDYETCVGHWGYGLEGGRRGQEAAEDRGSHQLRWNWLERFYEFSGATQAEIQSLTRQIEELEGLCMEVGRQTAGLRESCEWKLCEQDRMNHFVEAVGQRLQAFGDSAEIARALENSAVLASPSVFDATLDRIEHAATYMEMHHDFNGAEECIHQLEHLRGRGCILARAAVQRCLERSAAQVEQELWDESGERAVNPQIFQVPFRAVAPSCRSVAAVLHRRMAMHRAYGVTLDEMETIYAATRERLVLDSVDLHLSTLMQTQPDLLRTVNHASVYVLEAERTERELFGAFFELRQPQDALDRLLGRVADVFLRALRPGVVACTSVDMLREVAESLQVDVLDPRRQAAELGSAVPSSPVAVAMTRLHAELREQLIAQARAQIGREVVDHRPAPAELDYPWVCFGGSVCASSEPNGSRSEYQRGWYPTLVSTLGTLAKTYRVLGPVSFSRLARDATSACVASLRRVALSLADRPIVQPFHTLAVLIRALNSELFLIKHLLLLREQVASFECDSPAACDRDADLAQIRAAQAEMNSEIEELLDSVCHSFAANLAAWVSRPLAVLAAHLRQSSGGSVASEDLRFGEALDAVLSNLRASVPVAVALTRVYLEGPSDMNVVGDERKSTAALFPLLKVRILGSCARLLHCPSKESTTVVAENVVAAPLRDVPTTKALASLLDDLLEDSLHLSWEKVREMISDAPMPGRSAKGLLAHFAADASHGKASLASYRGWV
eukprot:TRINITY_DN10300_c0_g1_i1.p1 TRINITY_DN10300_c0_g1~~TRINITY_DN10300_c0_g1_i1.p1  ORF type:complete len:819 (+),score=128.83 TRINITY_DN10300_c0_g1_i1:96-2459(+)